MDVKDAIIKRKSIRKYDAAAVPLHIIAEVLDAARRAPSARNAQPWRFLVVQDRQTIEALKARRSTAQGGGREAAETLGRRRRKQSPERAAQSVCIAPSGLSLNPILAPRVPEPAVACSSTLVE